MNVSSIQSSPAMLATSSVTSTQSAPAAGGSGSAGGSKLSKMGSLMSQLQSLEQSDPDKAKTVLSNIASQLTDKANATGDAHIKELADKFTQAAQTGDLSSLKPQAPAQGAAGAQAGGHHHGGHHHHAGGGSDASKASSYTQTDADPMQQVESIISSAIG
jgi:hypothetical protein